MGKKQIYIAEAYICADIQSKATYYCEAWYCGIAIIFYDVYNIDLFKTL